MKINKFVVLCGVLLLCGVASATITITGDVDPNDALNWGAGVNVSVGQDLVGSVTIDGGSTIESAYSNIGVNATGIGTVTLDGADTKWTSNNGLRPGFSGTGRINITNGAEVVSLYTLLGYNIDSSGTIVVDGIGSKLSTTNYYIRVGGVGIGVLEILSGGLVDITGYCGIGYGNGSHGEVVVRDTGSILKMSGDLYIGRLDYGILTISDGGLVTVGGVASIDAYAEGNTAYIEMSNSGQLALYGNGSASITAFFDLVGGTDEIIYWNGSAWDNIANATIGDDYTLEYINFGDLTGYTLLTVTAENPNGCIYDIVGDVDNDCDIDLNDLKIMTGYWLLDCTYPSCLTTPECN